MEVLKKQTRDVLFDFIPCADAVCHLRNLLLYVLFLSLSSPYAVGSSSPLLSYVRVNRVRCTHTIVAKIVSSILHLLFCFVLGHALAVVCVTSRS